jgi:NAD(P)-dependent dehydrogenase (short-subunit alcohol dehydrogenase family)
MTAIRLKPIEEQVVVLIGVSSGIGRETALWFARKGAKVLVSARGEDGLNSLVEEIRGEGGEATMTIADTSEFDQVKAVADRAVEQYGRLDTWVHLAAVGLFATFELTTSREFERVVDVDLMGQVYGGFQCGSAHLLGAGVVVRRSPSIVRLPLRESIRQQQRRGAPRCLRLLLDPDLRRGPGAIRPSPLRPARGITPRRRGTRGSPCARRASLPA